MSTFKENYENEKEWSNKILIIELFHLKKRSLYKKTWTILDTAKYFGLGKSTVSENLSIAKLIHGKLLEGCKSRNEALKLLKEAKNHLRELRK